MKGVDFKILSTVFRTTDDDSEILGHLRVCQFRKMSRVLSFRTVIQLSHSVGLNTGFTGIRPVK